MADAFSGIAGGAMAGAGLGPWGAVAGGVIGAIGSFLSSDTEEMPDYRPNPTWLAMQEDIMRQVQKGMAAGGYTWDDATNTNLKRMALESAAKPYAGAQERITAGIAPYGNVGALGRSLVGLNTARAQEEAAASRGIDIAREENKLKSYQNLMNVGAGIQDPMRPQLAVNEFNAQLPTTTARLGGSLLTGAATTMNLNQAQKDTEFWRQYLTGNPMGSLNQPTQYNPLNRPLPWGSGGGRF